MVNYLLRRQVDPLFTRTSPASTTHSENLTRTLAESQTSSNPTGVPVKGVKYWIKVVRILDEDTLDAASYRPQHRGIDLFPAKAGRVSNLLFPPDSSHSNILSSSTCVCHSQNKVMVWRYYNGFSDFCRSSDSSCSRASWD